MSRFNETKMPYTSWKPGDKIRRTVSHPYLTIGNIYTIRNIDKQGNLSLVNENHRDDGSHYGWFNFKFIERGDIS